jgi:hypothetical protein
VIEASARVSRIGDQRSARLIIVFLSQGSLRRAFRHGYILSICSLIHIGVWRSENECSALSYDPLRLTGAGCFRAQRPPMPIRRAACGARSQSVPREPTRLATRFREPMLGAHNDLQLRQPSKAQVTALLNWARSNHSGGDAGRNQRAPASLTEGHCRGSMRTLGGTCGIHK